MMTASNNCTLSTFLYCSVHYIYLNKFTRRREKRLPMMAKVRSVHPTSNNISNREPSQHPFGGCYNVIELTLSTHKDVKPIKYKYISFQSTEEMRPDIQSINNKLRYTFLYGKSRNIKWRKRKLDKLKYFLLENQKEIFDCMVADVGRFCSTYCTKYV